MKTICFGMIVSNSNLSYRMLNVAMSLSSFLPYQLSMVAYGSTMAVTGNEEFGFDFGEGA